MSSNPPLSNMQQQLLKLYAAGVPDDKLAAISDIIANYLLEQARDEADKIWVTKKYGKSQLNKWLGKGKKK